MNIKDVVEEVLASPHLPYYAEHVHAWSFVPNGVVIDWRIQAWRVLRHCTSCDEFQNVTLALDA